MHRFFEVSLDGCNHPLNNYGLFGTPFSSFAHMRTPQSFFNVIPQATPLHYAAKQKGNLDVVKFLVENRAEIDCQDSKHVS